VSERT
jgi:hypothetical protein